MYQILGMRFQHDDTFTNQLKDHDVNFLLLPICLLDGVPRWP